MGGRGFWERGRERAMAWEVEEEEKKKEVGGDMFGFWGKARRDFSPWNLDFKENEEQQEKKQQLGSVGEEHVEKGMEDEFGRDWESVRGMNEW